MHSKRLIAPENEGWNEGEQDWSFVRDAGPDIERWETETGLALPGAYRRFMLAFNGGRVYPRLFRYTVPPDLYPSSEPVTFVDPFYSWADVERHWRGDVYGQGTPPEMLNIGGDPGGLQILLSLRPSDAGHIFCWLHTKCAWGSDQNRELWHQANSFEAFLDSLFDEPDGSDYENWHVPAYDKVAKPFVF